LSWLFITILAYFLFAANQTTDKFLLSKPIPNAIAYTFYEGALSIVALIFVPFSTLIIPRLITISFIAGILHLFGLYAFFSALRKMEASRAVSLIGALMAVFSFYLAFIILGENLNSYQYMAFLCLIIGGIVISYERKKICYNIEALKFILLAALLFASSDVFMKFVFLKSNHFWGGFIWSRFGAFLISFLFLIPQRNRREIFSIAGTTGTGISLLFLVNKSIAGTAFILKNFALKVSSQISLVNALQSTQFAFVFGLTTLLSYKLPKILKEEINYYVIFQKIFAIFLIALGFLILAIFK